MVTCVYLAKMLSMRISSFKNSIAIKDKLFLSQTRQSQLTGEAEANQREE